MASRYRGGVMGTQAAELLDDEQAAVSTLLRENRALRAMRGYNTRFMNDAERRQRVGGVAHRLPIGLAAHNDADARPRFCHPSRPSPERAVAPSPRAGVMQTPVRLSSGCQPLCVYHEVICIKADRGA